MGKDLKGKELGVGLTQRKDGRYSAKYTTNLGTRKEKYFDKITEARRWLKEQECEKMSELNGIDLTVDEWFNKWIDTCKKGIVAHNTEKNYRTRYKINIKPQIGFMNLRDVKKIDCQQVLNKMLERTYSEGTMQQTSITMHAIFDGAVENRYIQSNPATGLKIRKKPKAETRVLSREEQKEFLHYSAQSMYNNAYQLVFETGLRGGEIGGLKWEDIDFEKRELCVERTLLQRKEEGGFYFGEPKTETSKRTIPLTDKAISLLKEQNIFQKKMQLRCRNWCPNKQFKGLVFTTVNGNPVGQSTFNEMIRKSIRRLNEDRKVRCTENNEKFIEFEKFTMHTIRHTFATRCIENGMKPKTLQKIMGHSTVAVTMDIYVHTSTDELHKEMMKVACVGW